MHKSEFIKTNRY